MTFKAPSPSPLERCIAHITYLTMYYWTWAFFMSVHSLLRSHAPRFLRSYLSASSFLRTYFYASCFFSLSCAYIYLNQEEDSRDRTARQESQGKFTARASWQPGQDDSQDKMTTRTRWQPGQDDSQDKMTARTRWQPGQDGSQDKMAARTRWQPGPDDSQD
jgi:hypothetical protein